MTRAPSSQVTNPCLHPLEDFQTSSSIHLDSFQKPTPELKSEPSIPCAQAPLSPNK